MNSASELSSFSDASRNADVASLSFAISLIFIGLSKILFKFEELNERLDELNGE